MYYIFSKAANISEATLLRRSRGTEAAALRQLFSCLRCKEYGFHVRDIADYFGIGNSPASISISYGAELDRNDRFKNPRRVCGRLEKGGLKN